jgi:hypothetical protein
MTVDSAVAGVVVSNAACVPVAKISTSVICVAPVSGVANKLVSIGVLVTLGCCEYGWLHAEVMITTSISMEATTALRFIRAIVFSSVANKSFNDGSTSRLARQVMRWDIRGIPLVS